jgi:hypothetical protein
MKRTGKKRKNARDLLGSPREPSMTQVNGKKSRQRKRRNVLEHNRQGMCTEALLFINSHAF